MATAPSSRRVSGDDRTSLAATLASGYASGASIRALADQHGRSYGFVHRLLRESGVAFRGRGGSGARTPGAAPSRARR